MLPFQRVPSWPLCLMYFPTPLLLSPSAIFISFTTIKCSLFKLIRFLTYCLSPPLNVSSLKVKNLVVLLSVDPYSLEPSSYCRLEEYINKMLIVLHYKNYKFFKNFWKLWHSSCVTLSDIVRSRLLKYHYHFLLVYFSSLVWETSL